MKTPDVRAKLKRAGRATPAEAVAGERSIDAVRLESLQGLSALLAGATDESAVIDGALDAGMARLGCGLGAFLARQPQADRFHLVRSRGTLDPVLWSFARSPVEARGPFAELIERALPLYFQSFGEASARYPALAQIDPVSAPGGWAFLPLRSSSDVFGALVFGFRGPPVPELADLKFVEAVADGCAIAIDRLRARASLAETRDAAEVSRRLAEEERLLRGRFLSALSYGIRQPLNAAAGHAELLEMGIYGAVTAEQSAGLSRIKRSVTELQQYVEDVLAVARIDVARDGRSVVATRLRFVLERARGVCEPVALATGVALEVPEVPGEDVVAADPSRLQQILVQLLTNGLNFTPPGGRVWVERERSHRTLKLHVADTGPGIPPEDLERVFVPFSRIEPALPRPPKRGAGLGLPISRQLARAMGGDVTARSDGRTGSVFTLALPVGPATRGGLAPPEA